MAATASPQSGSHGTGLYGTGLDWTGLDFMVCTPYIHGTPHQCIGDRGLEVDERRDIKVGGKKSTQPVQSQQTTSSMIYVLFVVECTCSLPRDWLYWNQYQYIYILLTSSNTLLFMGLGSIPVKVERLRLPVEDMQAGIRVYT